jgi:hypothetical protein
MLPSIHDAIIYLMVIVVSIISSDYLPRTGKRRVSLITSIYIYKALFIPSFVNFRPASPEEYEKYRKLMIDAELKSKAKSENIKQTHQDILNQKSKEITIISQRV